MKMEMKRKAGVAILTPDKIGCKTEVITRDEKGFGNSILGYLKKPQTIN